MGRFGVKDAIAELTRHRVIDVERVRQVPLREHGVDGCDVVALDRGAGPELVVKIDQPGALAAVARFHATYADLPLVATPRWIDPASRFIAYDWVAGELGRGLEPAPDKTATLLAIVDGLLAHYVPAPADPPGRLHAPWLPAAGRSSWQHLLGRMMAGRRDQVHGQLPASAGSLVRSLASAPHRRGEGPLHLMHGDCGAHNLVFRDGGLVAVIDPAPMVGEPIFELAFAFASWPADLTLDAIVPAADALERSGRWQPPAGARRRVLIEEVLLALYSRTGTFVVNRPADVPAYVAAFTYWTDLLARA